MWLGRITLGCGIGLVVLSLVGIVMFLMEPMGMTELTGIGKMLFIGLVVGPGFIMYGSKKIKESSMPNIINASELLETKLLESGSTDHIAGFIQFLRDRSDNFWGLTVVYVTSDWKLGIVSSEADPKEIINILDHGQKVIMQQIQAEEPDEEVVDE
jgi:hypothetical protein